MLLVGHDLDELEDALRALDIRNRNVKMIRRRSAAGVVVRDVVDEDARVEAVGRIPRAAPERQPERRPY